MLIFDQLQKADRHLRMLSWIVALGVLTLLGGLWWVQVVRSRHYVENQHDQSYRTVRMPAPRGKIMDRNGVVLAENRPVYSISLYLGDRAWRDSVREEYRRRATQQREAGAKRRDPNVIESFLSWFGYQPALTTKGVLKREDIERLERESRYAVTSRLVAQLGKILGQPLSLNETNFNRHYLESRVLPLPIYFGLTPSQVARIQEQGLRLPGLDMEVQAKRVYPNGSLAAHVLGYMRRSEDSVDGELAVFDYRLPDYRGVSGLELSLDDELRGRAGTKDIQINNLGYRQTETIGSEVAAGHDVTLTLDAELQRKSENALRNAPEAGQPVRGAAVVLDCRTGEILSLVSAPTFNPSNWVPRITTAIYNEYNDTNTTPLLNRAIMASYPPGSTFKTIVALAGLEAGTLKTQDVVHVAPNPRDPAHGIYYVGSQAFHDLAPPGDYVFRQAFKKSSNGYFIEQGLRVGHEAIIRMAEQLHFGDRMSLPLDLERGGILPTQEWLQRHRRVWHDGDTGNLSIGQGYLTVSPLQMAVAMAAVANGGRVLWPQLILATNRQDAVADSSARPVAHPQIREQLTLNNHTYNAIRHAMLADTEDSDGTGLKVHVDGLRICAKTGTAQLERGVHVYDYMTWFASYAPYDDPHYVVVVMVQSGRSGGGTCAPVARAIYQELKEREKRSPSVRGTVVVRN